MRSSEKSSSKSKDRLNWFDRFLIGVVIFLTLLAIFIQISPRYQDYLEKKIRQKIENKYKGGH